MVDKKQQTRGYEVKCDSCRGAGTIGDKICDVCGGAGHDIQPQPTIAEAKFPILTVEEQTKYAGGMGTCGLERAEYYNTETLLAKQRDKDLDTIRKAIDDELAKHHYFNKNCQQNQKRNCKCCQDCPWQAILNLFPKGE